MSTPKATVISVNFNSGVYITKLIDSIDKNIRNSVDEIIIIDNNSKQSDKAKLKRLNKKSIIIFNNENVGFSKAVNQGIKLAKNNYILLLNPDCILIDTSIKKLIKTISENKTIGACGGGLVDPLTNQIVPSANGRPDFFTGIFEFTNLKKIFPNNAFTKHYWIERNSHILQKTEVSSLCGAFILFKKSINGQSLTFDESYFMYLEDVQFGIDINKLGFKVIFDPNVKIFHHGGKSNDSKYKTVLKYWYNSRKIFFKKNLSQLQGKLLEIVFTAEEHLLKTYHSLSNTPNE
ncbi:MAG: Glycosyl transferase family 2 [uncultured bacterium]|nr:MAG: Glycosyl transferase family 2 [uncultured bacterium]